MFTEDIVFLNKVSHLQRKGYDVILNVPFEVVEDNKENEEDEGLIESKNQ